VNRVLVVEGILLENHYKATHERLSINTNPVARRGNQSRPKEDVAAIRYTLETRANILARCQPAAKGNGNCWNDPYKSS
jgi:hypothetical protein